jgi:hypothetical protein
MYRKLQLQNCCDTINTKNMVCFRCTIVNTLYKVINNNNNNNNNTHFRPTNTQPMLQVQIRNHHTVYWIFSLIQIKVKVYSV